MNLYRFDEFKTAQAPIAQRPEIENLYDLFIAIRDDEAEQVKTILACQQLAAQTSFKSPHSIQAEVVFTQAATVEALSVK